MSDSRKRGRDGAERVVMCAKCQRAATDAVCRRCVAGSEAKNPGKVYYKCPLTGDGHATFVWEDKLPPETTSPTVLDFERTIACAKCRAKCVRRHTKGGDACYRCPASQNADGSYDKRHTFVMEEDLDRDDVDADFDHPAKIAGLRALQKALAAVDRTQPAAAAVAALSRARGAYESKLNALTGAALVRAATVPQMRDALLRGQLLAEGRTPVHCRDCGKVTYLMPGESKRSVKCKECYGAAAGIGCW
jgi:hypothetical protein